MKFFKKYWHLIFVSLITIGLGILVFLTSQQISQMKKTVAPTVPQRKPKAAEVCTLAFAITATTPTTTPAPTATPTPTVTPTPTPTATPTPTPTPRPTATPTPTPTPASQAQITPSPKAIAEVAPTAAPTPKIPVAGAGPSVLGAATIAGGLILLLLGLAL